MLKSLGQIYSHAKMWYKVITRAEEAWGDKLNRMMPFEINHLFCISTRVAFAVIKTKIHTSNSTRFLENGPFFGLKIHQLQAEEIAF